MEHPPAEGHGIPEPAAETTDNEDIEANDVNEDNNNNKNEAAEDGDMEIYDLRVTVDRIEGRSVCGMAVGDYVELTRSAHLSMPAGRHFCVYALASVLPFLAAKQRDLPATDWLDQDTLFACPDPEERLVMRVERTGRRRMRSQDLT